MPYKIVIRKLDVMIPEIHYIHAENRRDAKFKSLRFQTPDKKICGIDYIPMTEFLVKEECGIYEG